MNRKFTAGWRALQTLRSAIASIVAGAVIAVVGGCATLTQPIDGIPAHRLPQEFFPDTKNDLIPVDIALLTIEPPREYQIGPGDILGVYIEGVLPFAPPNAPPEPPPVNFPDAQSLLPPSIGFPIAVQDDGTLSLPLLEPLKVDGLTLDQVRDAIREAYISQDILRPEKARPIVTVIRERTYDVIVVREDAGGVGGGARTIRVDDRSASGAVVKLPAYQNDILHALVQTGGLPGFNAKNQVKVLRASDADKRKRAEFMSEWQKHRQTVMLDPCACPPRLPDDPSIVRIPLRVKPGEIPEIDPADVFLNSGDIVYIESRETEVFYTGGLLSGGEHILPRDYDLDVLGAMALAGGNLGGAGGPGGQGLGGGGMGGGLATGVPPGFLYVLRKTECNGQVAIEVDLAKAINNPRSRPLVQPGDILILRFKPEEELINAGVGTFFTFGVAQLLRGRN